MSSEGFLIERRQERSGRKQMERVKGKKKERQKEGPILVLELFYLLAYYTSLLI